MIHSIVTAQDANSWMIHAGKPIDFMQLLPLAEDEQIQRYLSKYWSQRYRLFMKYDGGIKMDRGKMGWMYDSNLLACS